MIQDVQIHKISITKKGQRHYFQINIPRNANHLVGIEIGFQKSSTLEAGSERGHNSAFTIARNRVVGELRLQCHEAANYFYSAELVESDVNLGIDDFLQSPGFSWIKPDESRKGYLPQGKVFLPSRVFTHSSRMEIDEIDVLPKNAIYGCYKDQIGKRLGIDQVYTVLIYVWFMAKENELL